MVEPVVLVQTLWDGGYTLSDPCKTHPFEDQEEEFVYEGRRFFAAIALSLVTVALVAHPAALWSFLLSAATFLSFVAFGYLVLRDTGEAAVLGGGVGLSVLGGGLFALQHTGAIGASVPWILGGCALVHGVRTGPIHSEEGRAGTAARHSKPARTGRDGGRGWTRRRDDWALYQPLRLPLGGLFRRLGHGAHLSPLSEWLALIVQSRTALSVKELLDLRPDTARVLQNGEGKEIPIEEIEEGDRVRIQPGETIFVDGIVREGRSGVGESLVTGDPIPKEKTPGNEVVGGSMNQTGTLLVEGAVVGDESFLEQVARQIEETQVLKPNLLHLVDPILRIHTPTVLVLLSTVGWNLATLWLTGDVQRAFFAGLSVLVMGYVRALWAYRRRSHASERSIKHRWLLVGGALAVVALVVSRWLVAPSPRPAT